MSAFSSTIDINPRQQGYAIANLLKRAIPLMPLEPFAQPFIVPGNSTTVANWRKYKPLDPITQATPEGRVPQGQKPTYYDITKQMDQYIGWIGITDVLDMTSEDPIRSEYSRLLAEQMAISCELIRYYTLRGGTNVFYSNGTSRADVNTAPTGSLFRKVVRSLERVNAPMVTEMLKRSVLYGSESVEGGWIVFCHSDFIPYLRDLPGFIWRKDYSSDMKTYTGEIGAFDDLRFVRSTLFKPIANAGSTTLNGMITTGGVNVDVYIMLVMAQDSWGSVVLRGSATGSKRDADGMGVSPISLILKDTTSGGAENPANQLGSMAWKAMFAAAIIEEDWLVRIECGLPELA